MKMIWSVITLLSDCRSHKALRSGFRLHRCVLFRVEILPHQLTRRPGEPLLDDEKTDLLDMVSHESMLENLKNCILHLLRWVCVCLHSCTSQYVQAFARWNANNIVIFENQIAFYGAPCVFMLVLLYLLRCAVFFSHFSLCRIRRVSCFFFFLCPQIDVKFSWKVANYCHFHLDNLKQLQPRWHWKAVI